MDAGAARPLATIHLARGEIDRASDVLERDAVELLGSDQLGLIRECEGPECTKSCLDTSRAHNFIPRGSLTRSISNLT